jgi:hypothetical protein
VSIKENLLFCPLAAATTSMLYNSAELGIIPENFLQCIHLPVIPSKSLVGLKKLVHNYSVVSMITVYSVEEYIIVWRIQEVGFLCRR